MKEAEHFFVWGFLIGTEYLHRFESLGVWGELVEISATVYMKSDTFFFNNIFLSAEFLPFSSQRDNLPDGMVTVWQ